MTAVIYLALVGVVTWYAWPAAPTWQARGWTFVLAFWLPLPSWPWLIWRGVRYRRQRRAEVEEHAQRIFGEQRRARFAWWLAELADALQEGDLPRAELAYASLSAMDLPPEYHQRAELLSDGLRVLGAPQSELDEFLSLPCARDLWGYRTRVGYIGHVRVRHVEGSKLGMLRNGDVPVRVLRS